tara:strand:+ start:886 stop:1347 length:462 start_codon:yes stop_codon:yes gene_type:complete
MSNVIPELPKVVPVLSKVVSAGIPDTLMLAPVLSAVMFCSLLNTEFADPSAVIWVVSAKYPRGAVRNVILVPFMLKEVVATSPILTVGVDCGLKKIVNDSVVPSPPFDISVLVLSIASNDELRLVSNPMFCFLSITIEASAAGGSLNVIVVER